MLGERVFLFEILREPTKLSSIMLCVFYIYYPLVVFENVLHTQGMTKIFSFTHLISKKMIFCFVFLCVWGWLHFMWSLDICISFCINYSFTAFAHFSSGLSFYWIFRTLCMLKNFCFFSVTYVVIFFLFCYFLLNVLMDFLLYRGLRCLCS